MVQRGGFDVVNALWLKETDFGVTPSGSEEWDPIWKVSNFDARKRKVNKNAVGVGVQGPSNILEVKYWGDITLDHYILKEETSPTAFKWSEFFQNIIADGSWTWGNHVPSFSICSKLDLTVDEFWNIAGAKIDRYEIRGDSIEDLVMGRVHCLSKVIDYTNDDIIGVSQTQQANPLSEELVFGDVDLLYGTGTPASILDTLNRFSVVFQREIERRGTDATTPKQYAAFPEKTRKWTAEITMDFDDRTALEDMIDHSQIKLTLKIPNVAGGKEIAFTGGRWLDHEIPERELDLLDLSLSGEFTALAITDIT